jgi:hypothetical protein
LHIKKKNKERGVSLWGKAPTKKTALLAYYAKIWKKLSSTFKTDREEKFWYVLDITDLVVYADAIDADQAATANRITFSNHLVKAKAKDRKVMLRMNDVAVGLISAADARAQIKRKLPPLYADGVFKGQAKVKKATCHVAVTFKNNRIVKIEILKPQGPNPGAETPEGAARQSRCGCGRHLCLGGVVQSHAAGPCCSGDGC